MHIQLAVDKMSVPPHSLKIIRASKRSDIFGRNDDAGLSHHLIGTNREVKEAGVYVNRNSVPMKFSLTSGLCRLSPTLVSDFDRSLHLFTSHNA